MVRDLNFGNVGSDLASLKQIMSSGDDSRPFHNFPPESRVLRDESTADYDFLAQYMNSEYFDADKIKKIRKTFIRDSSIQLADFLDENLAKSISDYALTKDTADNLGRGVPPKAYTVGVGSGWHEVGPPHMRRYLSYSDERGAGPKDQLGEMLFGVRDKLLGSLAFARYLERITTLQTVKFRDEIRRFRPALDYTVAHYGGMTETPRLDATICFVNDHGEEDSELWDTGDVGGFECYIEAEGEAGESAEAAEVYRSDPGDDDGNLLSVSPRNNVISLVLRDEGIMRFIKYVSCGAPGSRWDISMEYELHKSESD